MISIYILLQLSYTTYNNFLDFPFFGWCFPQIPHILNLLHQKVALKLLLYDTIINSIICYGFFVWWRALEKTTLARKLENDQRTVLISMCDAQSYTPNMALNAIFYILPVDIAERCMAAKVTFRLREAESLNKDMSENALTLYTEYYGSWSRQNKLWRPLLCPHTCERVVGG